MYHDGGQAFPNELFASLLCRAWTMLRYWLSKKISSAAFMLNVQHMPLFGKKSEFRIQTTI